MKTLKIIFTGLLLVLATLTSEALAQDNVVEASADVIAAVAVVAERGLSFGDVFQGTNKTIAPSAATSGSVQFSGGNDQDVDISFTLPATLSDGGTETLAISFSGTSAGYNNDGSTTMTATFDPSASYGDASFNASGRLDVFIGGTVEPTASQAAGNYTGDVTITVDYSN